MRRWCPPVLLLAVALIAAGCGGGSSGGQAARAGTSGAGPLTVFAASSLTEVLPSIDPTPRYSFAGSDELARQIREGAPADVFAAASAKYPQRLFAEGLVERPVTFATNRLVMIVPAGNPAGIRRVQDVSRSGTKLVVAGEGVPAGDYTRQVLAKLALTGALRNIVSNEESVKGVVAKVALGEADAGFAYATDVAPVAGKVRVIDLPAGAQPAIEYQVAVVSASSHRDAGAAFVRALRDPKGRAALTAAGFGLP